MNNTTDEIIDAITVALYAHNEITTHSDCSAVDNTAAVKILPAFTGQFPIVFAAVSTEYQSAGSLATTTTAATA